MRTFRHSRQLAGVSSGAGKSSGKLELRALDGRGPGNRPEAGGSWQTCCGLWSQHPGPWGALLTSCFKLCPCSPSPVPGGVLVSVLRKSRAGVKGDFPGGPVVKTPCFQCRGHKFNPWLGNEDPACCAAWPQINKFFKRSVFKSVSSTAGGPEWESHLPRLSCIIPSKRPAGSGPQFPG